MYLADRVLHPLELGEQRAEQLQLARIADLAIGPHRFDLREQEVFRSGVAGELGESFVPGHELRIVVRQAVDAFLQLDEPPDRQRVVMLFGPCALEMEQRGFVFAAVVEQIGEVDTGFAEARVQLQGAAQPVQAAAFVREPVRGVPDAGGGISRVRMGTQRTLEETARVVERPFAEQRAPDL